MNSRPSIIPGVLKKVDELNESIVIATFKCPRCWFAFVSLF